MKGSQSALFEEAPWDARRGIAQPIDDDETAVEWSEEEVVALHWRLLEELADLDDPDTPLDQKIDLLHWVFADRTRERAPFSFVNCLKVVSESPLSPAPYLGAIDAESIRDWIRHHLRRWLGATIDRYPAWAAQAVRANPCWIESRLAKNPQWINQAIRKRAAQGDLFA